MTFTMFALSKILIEHKEKEEKATHNGEIDQIIENKPELTQIIELVDEDILSSTKTRLYSI